MLRGGQGCPQSWARLLLCAILEILSSCLQATELRATEKLTAVNTNSFPTANPSLPNWRLLQSGVAGWQRTPAASNPAWAGGPASPAPSNTCKRCTAWRRLSGAQVQSVDAHLRRQASQSYFIVHLIFLKHTRRIEDAAPSESADTPTPSVPTPTLKDRGACSLWFGCPGVFPWQPSCPCLLQWQPWPSCSWPPGAPVGRHQQASTEGHRGSPHCPSACSGSPETAWAGGQLGYTSRSTEVVMGADVSCVRAPGDRV